MKKLVLLMVFALTVLLTACEGPNFKLVNVSEECYLLSYVVAEDGLVIKKHVQCDSEQDCLKIDLCTDKDMVDVGVPADFKYSFVENGKIYCRSICMPANIIHHFFTECRLFMRIIGHAELSYWTNCSEETDCTDTALTYCNYIAAGRNQTLFNETLYDKNEGAPLFDVSSSIHSVKMNNRIYCDFKCYDGKPTYEDG